MDYLKIYNQIIDKARFENRKKKNGIYYEAHHIVPKCLGGSDEKNNIILLTAKEHFIAHKLLIEIYPENDKLNYALWMMCNPKNSLHKRNFIISSIEYERVRKTISEIRHDKMVGVKQGPNSKEHNRKISESHRGEKNQWFGIKGKAHPLYGRKRPDLSESKKGEKNPMFGKTGDKSPRSKKVLQMNKNDDSIIDIFGSTMEAERLTGINSKCIQNCCRGEINSAGGFKWKYL